MLEGGRYLPNFQNGRLCPEIMMQSNCYELGNLLKQMQVALNKKLAKVHPVCLDVHITAKLYYY